MTAETRAEAARLILSTLFADVPEDHDDIDLDALPTSLVRAAGSGADYGMGLSYEDVVTVARAFLRSLAEEGPDGDR